MIVPRFSGNAIQTGKSWGWELFIRLGNLDPIVMVSKQSFLNRESALVDLRAHIPGVMETICEAMGLPKPEAIHDLNAGSLSGIEDWKNGK